MDNLNQPTTTQSNKDISLSELLDYSKKFLEAGDVKSALYYLNLTMIIPSLDVVTKFNILSIMCSAHSKVKNEQSQVLIARKVFKYLKGMKAKLPDEVLKCFIRILNKSATSLDEQNTHSNLLLSSLFFFQAKTINDDYNLQIRDKDGLSMESLEASFSNCLKKLTESLEVQKNNIQNDKYEKILKILHNNIDKNFKFSNNLNSKNDDFYLISNLWFQNMIEYLKCYTTGERDIDTIFNMNNVCLLYFSIYNSGGEDEEDRNAFLGCYPGPINNFFLTRGCEFWFDPENQSSNIYLDKQINDNDYILLPKEVYNEIKSVFGIIPYHEIERKKFSDINNTSVPEEIEVNLKKINLVIINELLRDNLKDEIKIKNLQISKYAKFSDLETKIIQCLKHILKTSPNLKGKENLEYDIKIYKYDKEKREIFDLVLSYASKNKSFKIFAKEMKKSENSNQILKDLNISNKDILIAEVIPKNTIVKPFIRVQSEILQCSICNAKINLSEAKVYNCDNCSQYIYCSDKCKAEDTTHLEYHSKISTIFKKKFTLQDLTDLKIETILDSGSKGGLTGLKNLGNTCFMNSALQCLSHCEDLSKYFLTKTYLDDIAKKGNSNLRLITTVYYELLKELWLGTNAFIAPWDFRQIFMSFSKQFAAAQNDSVEMVNFMLERLHDELIRDNPNSSVNNFTSIISDLFQGSLKTTIKCPSCKDVVTTYNNFNTLALPIPDRNTSKVRFKVFPNDFEFRYFFVEVLDLNKFTSIKDIKTKIREIVTVSKTDNKGLKEEFDALLLRNKETIKVLPDDELVYDYVYTRVDFSEENFIDFQVIFVQVEQSYSQGKNKGDFVTFYVTPTDIIEEKYLMMFKSETENPLTYPKAFSISKQMRLKDLKMEVFKYYRRIMNDLLLDETTDESTTINNTETDNLNSVDNPEKVLENKFYAYVEYFYNNINDKSFMESEYDKIMKFSEKNKPFELFLVNNIPGHNGWIFSKSACEYCKSAKCVKCRAFDVTKDDIKIYEFYATQQHTREFIIKANFHNYSTNFQRFYEEFYDPNDPRYTLKGDCSLYDCLELFRREEKLEKKEKPEHEKYSMPDPSTEVPICAKCNKNKEALKKIEIATSPKYLIFQFKRFKFKGHTSLMELVNNKKNEAFVDFPVDCLDMSPFLIEALESKKAKNNENKYLYELVAVSQHTGGLKAGHFTSLCRNKGKWYEFNDESVNEKEEISSPQAYLLFYQRKSS